MPCPSSWFIPPWQAELERERAQLLVRATVAEEQLSELQEYVDQHLGRWALEREHGVTPGPWSGRNGGRWLPQALEADPSTDGQVT